MRVVKTKPAKTAVKRKVCPHCAATLEYVQNDVKERHGMDYGGGPDGARWIDCGNCGKQIILERW